MSKSNEIGSSQSNTDLHRKHYRRASVMTDLFARASLSDKFKENRVHPTHIFVMIYLKDANPDIDVLKKTIGKRLLQFPRFSSIFKLNDNKVYLYPIPTDDVDLSYHIQSIDGKGTFGQEDLDNMITNASNRSWEVDKPLWNIKIVKNVNNERSLVFCQMDHSLGDGIALLNVLQTILDDTPNKVKHTLSRRLELPSVRWSHRIVSFLYGCYFGLIGWVIEQPDPYNRLKKNKNFDKSTSNTASKTFHQTKAYNLSEIKEIKNKMKGTTFNDIIVGVISMAVRRYLEKTQDPIVEKLDKGTILHAMVAVNVRSRAETDEKTTNLKNDFICMNFSLPLCYSSAIDVVWKAKAMIDDFKLSPASLLMNHVGGKMAKILPEFFLIDSVVESGKKPTCIISSIKGPSFESRLAGSVVEDINYFTSSNIGIYIGVLSYNNKLRISFATEKSANINCNLFQECVESGFEDLKQSIKDYPTESIEKPDLTPTSAKVLEMIMLVMPILLSALYLLFFAK